MSSLKIYTGPFKSYYFFAPQIFESLKKNQNNYLIILPVNRAVRSFKRKMIDAAPDKVVINPQVYTFDDILLQLYKTMP